MTSTDTQASFAQYEVFPIFNQEHIFFSINFNRIRGLNSKSSISSMGESEVYFSPPKVVKALWARPPYLATFWSMNMI